MENDPQTYTVIGAAINVHKALGCGFLEPVYQAALEREFEFLKIPFAREVVIPIFYRKVKLGVSYRADFICYGNVIVELKALGKISSKEESQVINYLKATRFERALLLNFGSSSLEYKRLVLTQK